MVRILIALLTTSLSSLKSRQALAVENLVIRQQLAVCNRKVKRPKLNKADRAFWLVLIQWWPKWREALVIGVGGGTCHTKRRNSGVCHA